MIKDEMGRVWDMLLMQIQKRRIKIEAKIAFAFDFGTKELMNMVGLQGTNADIRSVQLLDDKNMKLSEDKIVCTDILELAKTVNFIKKQEDIEKKREQAKNKIY
jgi:hypothetical protein